MFYTIIIYLIRFLSYIFSTSLAIWLLCKWIELSINFWRCGRAAKTTTLSRKRRVGFSRLAVVFHTCLRFRAWTVERGPKVMNVSTKTRPVYFSSKFQWLRFQLMEALGCRRCSKPCVLSSKMTVRLQNNFLGGPGWGSSEMLLKLDSQKHERCVCFLQLSSTAILATQCWF